jgi:hypothetical protein
MISWTYFNEVEIHNYHGIGLWIDIPAWKINIKKKKGENNSEKITKVVQNLIEWPTKPVSFLQQTLAPGHAIQW